MPPASNRQTKAPEPARFCPRCFFPENLMGSCGNFALGCPEPQELPADRAVTLSCGPCGRTLVVPVEKIMKKRLDQLGRCAGGDLCQAVVVLPVVERAAVPLKIGGDAGGAE